MPHPTLILCLALSIIIAAVTLVKPLILDSPRSYFDADANDAEFDKSLAALEMIAELEADFQMGKISSSDFEIMSLEYKREYLKIKASAGDRES